MSHWYTKDGRPMHEVEKKSGGMRPTTLRDARKLGLLPSVTTVMSAVAKPGLVKWQVEQGILAALTLPRKDDESLDEFAVRAAQDAVEQVKDAADLGTRIHAGIEDYAKHKKITDDAEVRPYVEAFADWIESHDVTVIWSEKVLIGQDYAGTADMLIELPDVGQVLIDIKTTKFRELKRGLEATFWPEWRYQLAAYAELMTDRPRIGNFALAKNSPEGELIRYEFKLYTEEEQSMALAAFHSIRDFWKFHNDYFPEMMELAA